MIQLLDENDKAQIEQKIKTVSDETNSLKGDLNTIRDDIENINPSVEVTVDDDETIVIGRGAGTSSGGNTTPSTPTESVTSDKYVLLGTYTLTPNGDIASCSKELDLEALGKSEYLISVDVSGNATNTTNLRIMDGASISGASLDAKSNPVRGTAQVSYVDGMCFGTACVDSGYGRNFASLSGSPRLNATQKKKVVVSFFPFVIETITATIKVYGRG